jgi:quercetin dioxygenase-like cupin family protein
MQIVRAQDTTAKQQTHRAGRIDLRRLFKGDPASPNNFEWSLVRMGNDYQTPRHRHNFSQIIMVLEGEHEWMPKAKRGPGSVTYTCEGTYYGPQQGGGAALLTLQFGEASGSGFLSYDALDEGKTELSKKGAFADGVFTWTDDKGQKHNQDSYEAIWEFVNGRPIEYSAPRYAAPITVYPESFAWAPLAGESGLLQKRVGVFSERGTSIEFLRYEPGARHRVHDVPAPELHFILEGALNTSQGKCVANSALMFHPGDDETLEAAEPAREYVIKLPDLRDIPARG